MKSPDEISNVPAVKNEVTIEISLMSHLFLIDISEIKTEARLRFLLKPTALKYEAWV